MRRVMLIVGVVASACVDPPLPRVDGGRELERCDAGADVAFCDRFSAERYVFTRAHGLCRFALQCCSHDDRVTVLEDVAGQQALALLLTREPLLFEEMDSCRRAMAATLHLENAKAWRSVDAGRQVFDRDASEVCLGWLDRGAEECVPGLVLRSSEREPAACRQVFRAAVPAGGVCVADDDCVLQSDGGVSVCVSSTRETDAGFVASLSGVCRPLPGRDEACSLPAGRCQLGLYCSSGGTCQPRLALGEVCAGAPCDEASYCEAISSQCQPLRSELSPCTSDDMCASPAKCSDTYHVCITLPDPEPLDVTFEYCIGTGAGAKARGLPGIPSDGGL